MMMSRIVSSLEKVFSDEAPSCASLRELSALQNERVSFQLIFSSDKSTEYTVSVSGCEKSSFRIYNVVEVKSDLPATDDCDAYFLRKTPGFYPDLLLPIDNNSFVALDGKWHSLWIELDTTNIDVGSHNIFVTLSNGKEKATNVLSLEVIGTQLPEQELMCTMWFHSDCLATRYGVEVFSDEHWRIMENYIKNAVEHGINFILTPLFTPPLDTEVGGERPTVQLVDVKVSENGYTFGFEKLDRFIKLCERCKVKYFEMSHLFTQWGAEHAPKIVADIDGEEKRIFGWDTDADSNEYVDFLRQFAAALTKFIDSRELRSRCRFHVSDEPSLDQYETYKRRAELIAELFPGFKVIDALSDVEFFDRGAVKYPIPSENHADAFVGKSDEFWTYYCCCQRNENVPNRFFAMPSARNRILGALLYKYNATGFLQWGYNFWYSQYSKTEIDPFQVTDADHAFPSGDSFVVYPGENGEPLNSLRLKVFYEALQDLRALRKLESLVGREKALEVAFMGENPTFKNYPHGSTYILSLRERINSAIKENI